MATTPNPTRPLDSQSTLVAQASPAVRREEYERMARRRFQRGSLKLLSGPRGKRWQLRYREDLIKDGKRVRVFRKLVIGSHSEFPTRKLAQREADKELAKINSVSYRPPVEGTFSAFAEKWQRDVLSQKKFSTQASEKSRIKKHLIPEFGELKVRNINSMDVQRFISGAGLTPKTTRNCIATLRMMWNAAVAWGYTEEDWFKKMDLPEYQKPEAPYFTLEEMQQIVAAATEPHKTFYRLAAETGMRLGELCALRVGSINFDLRVVTVRHSAWHGRVGSTKSKRPRMFRLSQQLIRLLVEQVAPVKANPDAYVFRTKNGTPWIGDDLVKDNLKPLLLRLKIKLVDDGKDKDGKPVFRVADGVGMHAFRHGNASLMDSERTPLKVRQDRLGHVDGEELTLGIYTHAESEDHQAVADKLGALLEPKPNPLTDMHPISNRRM